MPVEVYYKEGFGRRLRSISEEDASGLTKLKSGFYSSLDAEEAVAPVAQSAPVIGGPSTVGDPEFLVTPGVYTGTPEPVLTYQWYLNDVALEGETGNSVDTTEFIENDEVKLEETATNSAGVASQDSNVSTMQV